MFWIKTQDGNALEPVNRRIEIVPHFGERERYYIKIGGNSLGLYKSKMNANVIFKEICDWIAHCELYKIYPDESWETPYAIFEMPLEISQ